jgi:hypothetical protein
MLLITPKLHSPSYLCPLNPSGRANLTRKMATSKLSITPAPAVLPERRQAMAASTNPESSTAPLTKKRKTKQSKGKERMVDFVEAGIPQTLGLTKRKRGRPPKSGSSELFACHGCGMTDVPLLLNGSACLLFYNPQTIFTHIKAEYCRLCIDVDRVSVDNL